MRVEEKLEKDPRDEGWGGPGASRDRARQSQGDPFVLC